MLSAGTHERTCTFFSSPTLRTHQLRTTCDMEAAASHGAGGGSYRPRPPARLPDHGPDRAGIARRELARLPQVTDGVSGYERHRRLMEQFGSRNKRPGREPTTDLDVVNQHSRFLWQQDDGNEPLSWEERMAKRYYDRLFKEYAVADLSQHAHGRIGLRWRKESEVISGKGQFICANKSCGSTEGLSSYEVPFKYVEKGEQLEALVKVRVCPDCALRLNSKHAHRHARTKRGREEDESTTAKPEKDPAREQCLAAGEPSAPAAPDDQTARNADAREAFERFLASMLL